MPDVLVRSNATVTSRLIGLALSSMLVCLAIAPDVAAADAPPPMPPSQSFGYYHAVSPKRIVDTRPGSPIGATRSIVIDVTGVGGVPADGVTAVVVNVAAIKPTRSTYVTVYPSGETRPVASNLNVAAGDTVGNLVVVKVGTDGKIRLYNHAGSTDVIVDVAGWYDDIDRAFPAAPAPGGEFTAVSPKRIVDTRPGSPIGATRSIVIDVTGVGGVPADGVTAVVVNVAAIKPTRSTYVTVYPSGETRPVASNLNVAAGDTVGNLVVVKVGTDGKIRLYNHAGSTDVIVDVAGWYGTWETYLAGGEFTAVSPKRIVDTRPGSPIGATRSIVIDVTGVGGVPADGVTAVVVNVAAIKPTRSTYVTVYPSGETRPVASNLNVAAGDTVGNLVVVKVGTDGKIRLYNHAGSTDVIVDVAGWYGAAAGLVQTAAGSGEQARPGSALHAVVDDAAIARPQQPIDADAVRAFWTPARMAAARTSGQVAGERMQAVERDVQHTDLEPPYRMQQWGVQSDLPGAVGLLYFTDVPSGEQAVCTATVVWDNTLLTAAHCLIDAEDWMFVPGLDGANDPTEWAVIDYGLWRAYDNDGLPTPDPGFYGFDYALMVVESHAGVSIADETGALPVYYDVPGTWAYAIGYPAEGYFAYTGDPDQADHCLGAIGSYADDSSQWWDGVEWVTWEGSDFGFGCPMTGGSSGGPIFTWVGDSWGISSVVGHASPVRCWPSTASVTSHACPTPNPYSDRGWWHAWNSWGARFDQHFADLFSLVAQ